MNVRPLIDLASALVRSPSHYYADLLQHQWCRLYRSADSPPWRRSRKHLIAATVRSGICPASHRFHATSVYVAPASRVRWRSTSAGRQRPQRHTLTCTAQPSLSYTVAAPPTRPRPTRTTPRLHRQRHVVSEDGWPWRSDSPPYRSPAARCLRQATVDTAGNISSTLRRPGAPRLDRLWGMLNSATAAAPCSMSCARQLRACRFQLRRHRATAADPSAYAVNTARSMKAPPRRARCCRSTAWSTRRFRAPDFTATAITPAPRPSSTW